MVSHKSRNDGTDSLLREARPESWTPDDRSALDSIRKLCTGFHAVATAAPGAFFDVYNNVLGALPVVYRAARGTPGAPIAVRPDDILGGLAVRGYGATGFSGGQGQMMFRAAEPWTDAAHGTYLQLTTTPLEFCA